MLECLVPQGGNAVHFFFSCFLCLVRCFLLFFCRSSLLRAAFWKNFRERTFVFGWLCWACVFWWVFAIVFALFFGVLLPNLFGKILLMSGLVFSGFVLSPLGFLSSSSFLLVFFFERQRSGSNRTPLTRTCFSGFFLFVSRRFCLFCPFWPCVLLLGVFLGVPFWAPRVFGILLGPSEAFSWDARRQGFSVLLLPCVLFPLFVCFAATHLLSPSRGSRRSGLWGSPQPLARVRARGAPRARRVGPLLFWVFDGLFVSQRVTGTLGRAASRAFLYGEGAFLLPPHRPFSHARCFCLGCFFFLGPLARCASDCQLKHD